MNNNFLNISFDRLTRLEYTANYKNVSFVVKQAVIAGKRGWVVEDDEECSGMTREEAARRFVVKQNLFVS